MDASMLGAVKEGLRAIQTVSRYTYTNMLGSLTQYTHSMTFSSLTGDAPLKKLTDSFFNMIMTVKSLGEFLSLRYSMYPALGRCTS